MTFSSRLAPLVSPPLVSLFSVLVMCGAAACSASGGDLSENELGDGDGDSTGGSDGSGGDSSSGAASSTGGSSDGSGGATAAVDCSSLPVCDSFDEVAAGAQPDSSTWQLGLGWSGSSDPSLVAASTEEAHSAPNSIKISGGGSEPISFYATPPGDSFYTRAYMKLESPGTAAGILTAVGTLDGHNELRLRLREGKVTLNTTSGDGLIPDPSNCTDCLATPSDWFCMEMFYEASSQSISLWIDGQVAASVVGNAGWHNAASTFPTAERVLFGSFDPNGPSSTVYVDDVAISSSRIGCE